MGRFLFFISRFKIKAPLLFSLWGNLIWPKEKGERQKLRQTSVALLNIPGQWVNLYLFLCLCLCFWRKERGTIKRCLTDFIDSSSKYCQDVNPLPTPSPYKALNNEQWVSRWCKKEEVENRESKLLGEKSETRVNGLNTVASCLIFRNDFIRSFTKWKESHVEPFKDIVWKQYLCL